MDDQKNETPEIATAPTVKGSQKKAEKSVTTESPKSAPVPEVVQKPFVPQETQSAPTIGRIGPCPYPDCGSEATCCAGGTRHCNTCGRNF